MAHTHTDIPPLVFISHLSRPWTGIARCGLDRDDRVLAPPACHYFEPGGCWSWLALAHQQPDTTHAPSSFLDRPAPETVITALAYGSQVSSSEGRHGQKLAHPQARSVEPRRFARGPDNPQIMTGALTLVPVQPRRGATRYTCIVRPPNAALDPRGAPSCRSLGVQLQ